MRRRHKLIVVITLIALAGLVGGCLQSQPTARFVFVAEEAWFTMEGLWVTGYFKNVGDIRGGGVGITRFNFYTYQNRRWELVASTAFPAHSDLLALSLDPGETSQWTFHIPGVEPVSLEHWDLKMSIVLLK